MNVLDLFAGIGGFSLGLKRAGGFETVCYVEKDPYAQKILLARMRDGQLDRAPLWNDITTFQGRPWKGVVDVVTGGFPCQDISLAGKGEGIGGERSGLWFQMWRTIRQVRPSFVIIENVPALRSRGLWDVLGDLAQSGYDSEWDCVPASAVGAPHRRDRIWIVAYAARNERREVRRARKRTLDGRQGSRGTQRLGKEQEEGGALAHPQIDTERAGLRSGGKERKRWGRLGDGSGKGGVASDSYGAGLSKRKGTKGQRPLAAVAGSSGRTVESRLGRSLDGVSSWMDGWEDGVPRVAQGVRDRVHRLRCLGNAVVPQVVERIGRRLNQLLRSRP